MTTFGWVWLCGGWIVGLVGGVMAQRDPCPDDGPAEPAIMFVACWAAAPLVLCVLGLVLVLGLVGRALRIIEGKLPRPRRDLEARIAELERDVL